MPTPSRLPIGERNPALADHLTGFGIRMSIETALPSTTDLVAQYAVTTVAHFVVIAHLNLTPFLVADLALSCGWVPRGEPAVEGREPEDAVTAAVEDVKGAAHLGSGASEVRELTWV